MYVFVSVSKFDLSYIHCTEWDFTMESYTSEVSELDISSLFWHKCVVFILYTTCFCYLVCPASVYRTAIFKDSSHIVLTAYMSVTFHVLNTECKMFDVHA